MAHSYAAAPATKIGRRTRRGPSFYWRCRERMWKRWRRGSGCIVSLVCATPLPNRCVGCAPRSLPHRPRLDVALRAQRASCCQSAIAASHRAFRQSAEKSEQVSALLASASARLELSRVRRVVDVGCGKGHLVSKLRSELGVPALGVDVDDAVLDAARATYPEVECFECRDVVAAGLPLQAGDLVVGLHPCGALGEAIVRAVRDCARGEGESGGGGDGGSSCALLMVPCCWHKQGSSVAAREPLSERARMLDAIAETASGGDECGVAIEDDDDATAASVTGNGGGAASAAVGGGGGMRLPLAALKKASMALDSTGSVQTRRAPRAA